MRKSRKSFNKESAVSETVGFIIIFGIMMTGIGLVTLYGYPLLLQEQSNANIRNMERNMIVLQNEINGLTYKNIPYQETTLQVSGGTLMVDEQPSTPRPYFEISKAAALTYLTLYPGEFEYISDNGDTVIVLENGAVHKRYWSSLEGSVMIAEPKWFYDEPAETFVMSFFRLNATDDMAQTGIGTVAMMITNSSEQTYDVTGSTIKVEYRANPEDNYNIAWRNYFNDPALKMTFKSGDGFYSEYHLDSGVKKLVIKTYNITVL
ncbi:MAG TPA: hypothetical protein VMW63_06840, partial [Methanoregulaceae archaeon]|nr:hypothetical protein [Methanoregulaceae archaeon]